MPFCGAVMVSALGWFVVLEVPAVLTDCSWGGVGGGGGGEREDTVRSAVISDWAGEGNPAVLSDSYCPSGLNTWHPRVRYVVRHLAVSASKTLF